MQACQVIELIEQRVAAATLRGGVTTQDYAHVRHHLIRSKGITSLAQAALELIESHGPRDSDYWAVQEVVGRLLVDLTPETSIPLDEWIGSIAEFWNPSVEQVPQYLSDVFGRNEVLSALMRVRSQALSARAKQAIDTMSWWLAGKQKAEPGATDNPVSAP